MVIESGPQFCPTFRPTKEEFSKPFCQYVSEKFRKNPGLAMFKVVPPRGYIGRRTPLPDFDDVVIQTPIKQMVFGTRGAFRSMLIEQKPMTVNEYKALAESENHRPPKDKGRGEPDELMERAFWSSVTINPPLYGADTPVSFFDKKLPWGWNLRNLHDLLQTHEVPDIPGGLA
jgi:jumonji domain-containing protein 2